MYNGWFCLGGVEIINNTRAVDYARTSPCGVTWFTDGRCEGMNDRLDQPPYNWATISEAPWYDTDVPALASEFLGVYCISQDGVENETLEAPITERVVGGAIVGRQRDASKSVRFRVLLSGLTARGVEYGRAWLAQVLRESLCGTHSGSCGTSDLRFMTMCPWPWEPTGGPKQLYWDAMDAETRILHGVKCTTGLIKEQEFNRKGAYGMVFEFTLTAEEPRMIGIPYFIAPANQGELIIQDTPYNLHPTPSAELSEGTVLVSQNYSLNPSVETNATGWAKNQDGTAITAAMVVGARVTGELAAVGVASYRSVFTATGAGANGWFGNEQEVALPTLGDRRFSVNIWSAEVIMAGTPTQGVMEVHVLWRGSSGGATIRDDNLGTIPVAGGAKSVQSIDPPAGATHALVRVMARMTSWANGNVVRLYSDALAVTVP